MPDFTVDTQLTDKPQLVQQPLPDDYHGGQPVGTAPVDPFNQFVANGNKNLPSWMAQKSLNFITPYKTQLDQTLRYTDPNLGFSPIDANLEDEYANAHPLKTLGNNILQGGARFLGAATEAIATIPLAINAAVHNDFSKLYNNDLTNGIDDWLKTLNNSLPVYQTNYERDNPILKYLNPLKLTSFSGAIGGAVNNLGFVGGAVAGSLLEDAAITSLTGGAGLFPAVAGNINLLTKLSRASRAIVAAPEETAGLIKSALKLTGEDVATTSADALLQGGTRSAVRSTGEDVAAASGLSTDEVMASQKANQIKGIINNNAKAYAIRDAVKYNLALLSSATAQGAFQAVDVYKNGVNELSQKYFNENGKSPTGQDLQDIITTSKSSANIAMGANIAFAYLSGRLNFGSLFKPTQQALDETITGFGSSIARTKVETSALDEAGKITYSLASKTPETTIGKILLNGQKIGNKAGIAAIEGLQFGAQGAIGEASMDYNLRKYDAQNRGEVVSYLDSFLKGVDKTFSTSEGWSNMMMGFVIGAFGSPFVHKFSEAAAGGKQLSPKEQMQQSVDILNSATLKGTMENQIQEAAVQTSLAGEHKEAVQNNDEFGSRNTRFEMLYNWVTSGIRANSYNSRVEELNVVRDLTGKSFESYWGKEDNSQNRQGVNDYLDNLQKKAESIKGNYEKITRLTRNPYDPKKQQQDYQAYESYKDALALNLSKSEDYQTRLTGVKEDLTRLSPGIDIQSAVDMTSIGGLRNILRKLGEATDTIGQQMQVAKEAGTDDITLEAMHQKHMALSKLFGELQPLVTTKPLDEGGNNITNDLDGKKFVDILQKLYKLHTGTDFTANEYLDEQKNLSDGTIHIKDQTNKVTDSDSLAKALQQLQDVYKLSESNLNVQRYYNYLRKGVGADQYMKGLSDAINARFQALTNKDGEIKTPAEIHDEIEQDTRHEMESPDIEEATKEERDTVRTAAKKVVAGETLTDDEQKLTDAKPERFANEVNIQQAVKQRIDEKFGTPSQNKNDGDPIAAEKTYGVKLKDLFGMFSQDKGNAVQFRTNLYKAIFKSGANGVFKNLSVTFESLNPENVTYFAIPNSGLYRSTFNENIKISHNGEQIGILRPADSLWLDNTGTRSIYDITPEEYEKVTGNPANTYKDFVSNIRAYQKSYNDLKAEMVKNPEKQFTYDDIKKHFDLSINSGSSVQNRYSIQQSGNKFNIIDPNKNIAKTVTSKQEAANWIVQNNNKLGRFDTLLKDLKYKPEGTALVSYVDVVEGGYGKQISKKSKEGVIVNKEDLTPSQIAKLETFLEGNTTISDNVNRYAVILPVNDEYQQNGVIFARNADTTAEDRVDYFSQIKNVANGTAKPEDIDKLVKDLNSKYFIANNDRTIKQTFITTKFNDNGDMVLSINNPSLKTYKDITIPKAEIQETKNYGDLITKIQSNINNEAHKDTFFAKLQVDLTEDSLKRQIPDDEKVTKLSQVENQLKVATTPDVFENFNINFNPKDGIAKTAETPKPITPIAEPTSFDINRPQREGIVKEYQQKRNTLQQDFNTNLTGPEARIKAALNKDISLANNKPALLKAADATQEDLNSYSKKASVYNEQFNTYKNIQQQKLDNLTNVSKPIFAKTKAGVETIGKDLFGLTDEQAKATSEVYDLNAKAWAARTGKPVDDYYKQLGFKSQLDTDNTLKQTSAIQKIVDYLKLDSKKIGANITGYTKEGLVGQKLADRVGEVIKEQNLQDLVGARWNKTYNTVEFYPKDAQGVLFQKYSTNSDNFKKWFGNSIIKNKKDDPLIVYHGTINNFDEFQKSIRNLGVHFGNKNQAENAIEDRLFENDGKPNLLKGYLKIENPLETGDIFGGDIPTLLDGLKEAFTNDDYILNNENYPDISKKINSLDNLLNQYYKENFKNKTQKESDDITSSYYRKSEDILKSFGYDGIIYENAYEGSGKSYVVFDVNQFKTKDSKEFNISDNRFNFQGAKGAYDKLTNTIYALTNPDVTTPLHELAHSWEPLLTAEENKTVLDWAKHDTWTTETSEKFANGFENYLANGKAPTPALEGLFQKFAKWMQGVVQKVKSLFGNDFQLNKPMEDIYANMLNSKSKIETTNTEIKNDNTPTNVADFEKNPHQLYPDDNIELVEYGFGNKAYIITNNGYNKPLIGTGHYNTEAEAIVALNKLNIKNGFPEKKSFRPIERRVHDKYPNIIDKDITFTESGEKYLDRYNVIEAKLGDEVIGKIFKSDTNYSEINSDGKYSFIGETKKEAIEDLVERYNSNQSLKAFKEVQSAKKEFDNIERPKIEPSTPKIEDQINKPLEDSTDYGKVSKVQKAIKDGYYEKQIKDGKLSVDQVKEIVKSAGLHTDVVDGIKFRIDNPDLIKALKDGIPKGINVTYLRGDLNNAIKDGRFGEAIRNEDVSVEKAKEILKYFNKSETPFVDDFAEVERKQTENLKQQPTNEQPLTDTETEFINTLKAHQADLKGVAAFSIKDQLSNEDYRGLVDDIKSNFIDDTNSAKKIFNNDEVYKAFKKLTGAEDNQSNADELLNAHKDVFEQPESAPKEQTKYVAYKEIGPNDTVVEHYGKLVQDNGLTSDIEDARGKTITRVTGSLKEATKDQFDSQKTHVETAQYIRGDKVSYGEDGKIYTIADSEQRLAENGKDSITVYTTEEGPVINEAGIKSLARLAPAAQQFKIRVEHQARERVLRRISSQFEKVFPQIKTEIGYYDFNAPARFNHGKVEINIGYGDKKMSREEINIFNANDPLTTPWLKREAIAHEYMHPFILALKDSNSALYNKLIEENNKSNKDITDHVQKLVKEGTYHKEQADDEALALYLGNSITKAFNKDGTLNEAYVKERKNSLVAKFINWLTDVFNYLTGKKKPTTLDEFIKNANSDLSSQKEDIRSSIKSVPEIDDIYKKEHGSDITKTIAYIKRSAGIDNEGNIDYDKLDNFIDTLKEKNKDVSNSKITDLVDKVADYLEAKPTGRFEFIERINSKDGVEFDQSDENNIKVYVDPTFGDDLSKPSILKQYSANIIDNDAAKEFNNLVERSAYKNGNNQQQEQIGVKSLNPLMQLQDVSDFVVKNLSDGKTQVNYDANEIKSIDELRAYMDLSETDAKRIRENIVGRLKQLRDTADVRLKNDILKQNYNVLNRLNLDESDTDFVLKYVQQGAISINLAWRKFNEIREDLKDPELTKPKLNRLNKDLDVVKQLVSFYDDFNSLYNKFDDEFNVQDIAKFNKVTSNLNRLRDDISETAINLAVKWFTPYVENHNNFIKKEGYTDPKYLLTEKDLYNNLRYGTSKDTNFVTFSLGATVTSRDPVNAIFSNMVADMLSVNNVHIVNNSLDINDGFNKFLKDKNIGVGDNKAQIQYYKDHYLRQADILTNHYNEATDSYEQKYIKKAALHQEYLFDKYDKDLSVEKTKYANPRSGEEANQFEEKLNQWKKDRNFGESAQYLNKDYAALKNDDYFKLLEKNYNEANVKYGENQLQYGIIPQQYDLNTVERLTKWLSDVKEGKTVGDKFNIVSDKVKLSMAGIKKDNSKYNLDDTIYRNVKSNLNIIKQDDEIVNHNLHRSIIDFLVEGTNYGSLKEVQYNAENLRSLIEGNVKFSIPSRKIGREDFEAKIRNPIQLRKATERLAELQKLKDSNQEYDQDLYTKLQARVDKGVEVGNVWDKFAGTVKPSATNRLNEQLLQFINDTFYGESVEEAKLGSISLNKAAHYLSMYTSINNMAFNTVAGVSNVIIGDVQMLIEGHGGKFYNKAELGQAAADYIKNIPTYMADLQNPIKSKDTQLTFLLDAIQGEVLDEFGNRISGNIAKRMFNTGSLFMFTSLGEHQIQTTGMKAMLLGRKVETMDGKTISLYDAFIKDASNRYSLRKDLKGFGPDDLQHFIRQLHSVNRSLNGNYSALHKGTLQRKWYGTLMLKFRKYLYDSFRSRYASEHTDYEKNTVETGYLRFFLKDYLYKNFKGLVNRQLTDFKGENLKPNEKYQLRKATMEVGIYMGISVAIAGMFGGTQKKDLSPAEKALLLYSLRLRNDLGMYHLSMASEIKQQTQNPTASMTTLIALDKTLQQLMSPTQTYTVSSNGHQKGDSKLAADTKKLIPILSKFPINMDNKLSYFNLVNQNVTGVTKSPNAQ